MALANGTSDGGQQPPAERMVTLRDYGAPSGLDALTGTRHVQTAGPLALDYQMAGLTGEASPPYSSTPYATGDGEARRSGTVQGSQCDRALLVPAVAE